jgi:hypothetical protein
MFRSIRASSAGRVLTLGVKSPGVKSRRQRAKRERDSLPRARGS